MDRPCDAQLGRGKGSTKTRDDEQMGPVKLTIRGDEVGKECADTQFDHQLLLYILAIVRANPLLPAFIQSGWH
jgi:hypothetical protein